MKSTASIRTVQSFQNMKMKSIKLINNNPQQHTILQYHNTINQHQHCSTYSYKNTEINSNNKYNHKQNSHHAINRSITVPSNIQSLFWSIKHTSFTNQKQQIQNRNRNTVTMLTFELKKLNQIWKRNYRWIWIDENDEEKRRFNGFENRLCNSSFVLLLLLSPNSILLYGNISFSFFFTLINKQTNKPTNSY